MKNYPNFDKWLTTVAAENRAEYETKFHSLHDKFDAGMIVKLKSEKESVLAYPYDEWAAHLAKTGSVYCPYHKNLKYNQVALLLHGPCSFYGWCCLAESGEIFHIEVSNFELI